ncbi:UNVERIFIED_CONTAM: hypothetical protein GTU68_052951 [Idotea baltica]|nr:hypothetical protein [Idotea baltica]
MNIPVKKKLHHILKEQFGYDHFRPYQEEIIDSIMSNQDTVAIMPTGGGKSLCFQIPAIAKAGLTVVVSPLIALMKDQVDALRQAGVGAAFINSTLPYEQQADIWAQIRSEKIKLLYMAPEGLVTKQGQIIPILKNVNLQLVAVDEAHCISQWGHDFRPEYLKLAQFKSEYPDVPMIALTATADQRTQDAIVKNLKLKSPNKFIAGFNRPNIHYHVTPKNNSKRKLLEFLRTRREESGIIYCLSRKSTEAISAFINQQGFDSLPYHAGLDRQQREDHQSQFSRDETKIIVATIAFGMGIDKSNVRYVVHMDLPKNIEAYYQETGRAGRDGVKSDALLFFSRGDLMILKSFVEVDDNDALSKVMLHKLDQMADYSESTLCRRKFLLNYFDEDFEGPCNSCDNCLRQSETFDGTIIAQKAISAVARLDQRYGIGYVIDLLRGSKAKKIKPHHKTLKTYGVGSDYSVQEWRGFIRNLIDLDILQLDRGEYPILKLAPKSKDVIYGQLRVELIKEESLRDAQQSYEETNSNKELLTLLKVKRTEIAKNKNIPPYLVFSDATLLELSTYLPISKEHLERISGFGEVKIQAYGEPFLSVISAYMQEHDLKTNISNKLGTKKKSKSASKSKKSKSPKKEKIHSRVVSMQLFKSGKNIAEIAQERGYAPQTIEGHLAYYIRTGELKISDFIEDKRRDEIAEAIHKIGGVQLTPIKKELGPNYSFGQIRLVMEWLNSNK